MRDTQCVHSYKLTTKYFLLHWYANLEKVQITPSEDQDQYVG